MKRILSKGKLDMPFAIAGATVSIYRARASPTATVVAGTTDSSGNFMKIKF